MQAKPPRTHEPTPCHKPQVAVGVGLRALAAHVFHQAAEVGELLRTGLEFVELVARAAVMDQLFGVETRPLPGVEVALAPSAPSASESRVSIDPARMRRAAGDVDHRQTGSRAKVLAEQAAFLVAVELQTAGVGDVFAGGMIPP
jgi:hypothetical protein